MSGIATAIVGSAVIGGIASNRASSRMADAQRGASDAAAQQAQIATEQWDRYNEIYDPIERSFVNDAQNYDSPENFQRAAGDASATVSSQFGKARDRLTRTPGLDPTSASYQASMVGLDLAQAATDATQQNAARQKVKDVAYARKTDALSLGKGLPAQAMTGLNSATSAFGNIATQQGNLALSQAQSTGSLFSPDRLMSMGRGVNNWLNPSTGTGNGLQVANTPASNYEIGSYDYSLGGGGGGYGVKVPSL